MGGSLRVGVGVRQSAEEEIQELAEAARRERRRDAFACAALTGLLAAGCGDDGWTSWIKLEENAFIIADAMLLESGT